MATIKVTLKKRELAPLFNHHAALDGRKDGDKVHPYKFKGGARLAIAENMAILKSKVDPLNDANTKMQDDAHRELPDVPWGDSHPNAQEYLKDWNAVLAEEVEVELNQIDYEDLKAEDNGLPVSTLMMLKPLLKTG